MSLPVWGAIVYSGIGALVVGNLIWYHGVSRIGPTRVSMFSNLQPLVALAVAWIVLGEVPTDLAGPRRGQHHDRPHRHSNLTRSVVKLVLFDIDGTILWSDGAGRRAMQRALTTAFGTSGDRADYRYDGKTDLQIVRDLMRLDGHADDAHRRAHGRRCSPTT